MMGRFLMVRVLPLILGAVPVLSLGAADLPTKAVAGEVDLRPEFAKLGLEPRRQGSRPTCSVFAFTGALEFAVARARQRGERLSVEYLNWAANQRRRDVRDGGFFSDMWKGFSRHGICAERDMPYLPAFDPASAPVPKATKEAAGVRDLALQNRWIKEWNVNTGLSDAELAKLKEVLRNGWPVCGGFRWPKRATWKGGVLEMREPDQVFDGHSVLLTGYRDDASQPGGGLLHIRDSNTGKDVAMPYDYAKAYMNDALSIEVAATVGSFR